MPDTDALQALNDNLTPLRVGAPATVGSGAKFTHWVKTVSLVEFQAMPYGHVPPPTREILEWHRIAVEKLTAYTQLKLGWDTYHGQPLRSETGYFAMAVLSAVMTSEMPIPQIVPTPAGGVQFEWHVGQRDIEFAIDAPYDCELWFRDLVTGATDSLPVRDGDISALAEQLALL
jgi:hypothetical protein